MRRAGPFDLAALEPLAAAFHGHEGIPSTPEHRQRALGELLADPRLGAVILACADAGEVAGYGVLCLGFSVEFGGRDAFVDELYVRDAWRGRGVGVALLGRLEQEARAAGVVALHLEASHGNPAHALYRRLGFADHARHLMTKALPAV